MVKGKSTEIIKLEEERELMFKKSEESLQELSVSFRKANIQIIGIPETRRMGQRVYLKK